MMVGFEFLVSGGLALAAMAGAALADVYVPEGGAGTILHLSTELQPLSRISGLDNVHGLAIAAGRSLLIAGSLSEVPRGEVAKPEAVSADDHAAHHAGAAAALGDVSLVSLIDVASERVLRQIEVPGGVHHVTVSSDEKYALVTHPSLDTVSIIDLDTNTVTTTIPTGPNPNYAVYDPQSASFYVSNAGNSTISQLDPKAGYVVRNIRTPDNTEHLEIDVANRRLFAVEGDAGVLDVLDLDSGMVTASYTIGGTLHGLAYDAARNTVLVSARAQGALAVIDLASGAVQTWPIGPEPYHLALVGGLVLISSAVEPMLWAVDAASQQVIGTIATADIGHQMAVTP